MSTLFIVMLYGVFSFLFHAHQFTPADSAALTASALPIPEPSTIIFFVTGLGALGYRQFRRKKHVIPVPVVQQRERNVSDSESPEQEARFAIIGKAACHVLHDVKNSLTGIRTCADVLAFEDVNFDERKEFARMITTEIERIVDLTEELMDFSCCRNAFHLQQSSVQEMMRDLLPLLTCNFHSRHMSVHTDLQYTGEIQADIRALKRVVMNLADNARDAMSEGGTFTIASRVVNDEVSFEFTDTGCGMSPELQARMFLPGVTSGKAHGTGLGLAIVKEILDRHHARIDVQSAVSQGTAIRIVFPRF